MKVSSKETDNRPPEPGEVVDGTFVVRDRLGGGASGEVFSVVLGREWAGLPPGTALCLKWYKNEIFNREPSPTVVARRVREATLGGSLNNQNLVKGYDASEFWPEGRPRYLVMELLRGEDLERLMKRVSISPEQAWRILLDIAKGLKALHDSEVLHRDVKASNVIVTPAGRAVLLDLGVARPESELTMTDVQAFLGTLRFAAPEWLFAEACDHLSDVYSLGTIAYHLLIGREIFEDIRLFSRLVEAVRSQDPMIPDTDPDLHRRYLANLTRRMLRKSPSERPSLGEVIETLEDTGRYLVWAGLTESRLFDRMPEYCRIDSAAQKSVVLAISNRVPQDEFVKIVEQRDYDRLLSYQEVRDAIAPPRTSDPLSLYLAVPKHERLAWATQMLNGIAKDGRLGWGQQIEARWSLARHMIKAEESEQVRRGLQPLLDEADAEMNDMISTLAQENP